MIRAKHTAVSFWLPLSRPRGCFCLLKGAVTALGHHPSTPRCSAMSCCDLAVLSHCTRCAHYRSGCPQGAPAGGHCVHVSPDPGPAGDSNPQPTGVAQPRCCPAITLSNHGRWGPAAATAGAAAVTRQQPEGAGGVRHCSWQGDSPCSVPVGSSRPGPAQTPRPPFSTADTDSVTSVTNTGPSPRVQTHI